MIGKTGNKLLSRLLAQRNISVDDVDAFLSCDYKGLSDPFAIKGMEKAVRIFCDAIKQKKKIAVIGDYDCDGIFSSVIIREACRMLNTSCKVFLPSRMEHGYGLNDRTIEAFQEVVDDVGLLFLLDCGTNNNKEIDRLKSCGIEKVIVIDHHIVDPDTVSLSADVLINYHLCDCQEMCAAGLAFQFVRGLRKLTSKIDPVEFLSYAAIGTIADMSPVIGDNRIIVRHGLDAYAMNRVVASGLGALKRSARIFDDHLTQEDVSFRIAPRINAVGRLEDPIMAYGLLVEQDQLEAEIISTYVDSSNRKRKEVQHEVEFAVEATVESGSHKHGILVYSPDWHIGVVGIVASRMAETFHKPALILGQHKGIIKGSGRTWNGINLKEILDSCSEMFVTYGGHAEAAGVTLKPEYVKTAAALFDEACRKYCEEHIASGSPDRQYDAEIPISKVTFDVARLLLEKMYPYSDKENPEPIFKLSGVTAINAELTEGDSWRVLKFECTKDGVKAPMSFKMFGYQYGTEISGMTVDIYFSFPQKLTSKAGYPVALNVMDLAIYEKNS
ncbi:MAG: DHH family phosphoesterase [Methanomassiliicoccales archaeon]|jgi:single-stranded-DNA-specific exonuclease